jgi:WD repeat and SOF domain-containing protein 1
MSCNSLCWNPMEAFNFTVVLTIADTVNGCALTLRRQANEDNNLYSFDMRKLDRSTCIHEDHVAAVYARCAAPRPPPRPDAFVSS